MGPSTSSWKAVCSDPGHARAAQLPENRSRLQDALKRPRGRTPTAGSSPGCGQDRPCPRCWVSRSRAPRGQPCLRRLLPCRAPGGCSKCRAGGCCWAGKAQRRGSGYSTAGRRCREKPGRVTACCGMADRRRRSRYARDAAVRSAVPAVTRAEVPPRPSARPDALAPSPFPNPPRGTGPRRRVPAHEASSPEQGRWFPSQRRLPSRRLVHTGAERSPGCLSGVICPFWGLAWVCSRGAALSVRAWGPEPCWEGAGPPQHHGRLALSPGTAPCGPWEASPAGFLGAARSPGCCNLVEKLVNAPVLLLRLLLETSWECSGHVGQPRQTALQLSALKGV